MDLGITGRTAIVNAASKGLGRACATSLAREGVSLFISARGGDVLEATARDIRDATGASVTTIVADVATDEGRAAVLKARPPATSTTGRGTTGSRRLTPTCCLPSILSPKPSMA
jgi:3-oxoacyl-[acyl-carrier protein] reductase